MYLEQINGRLTSMLRGKSEKNLEKSIKSKSSFHYAKDSPSFSLQNEVSRLIFQLQDHIRVKIL